MVTGENMGIVSLGRWLVRHYVHLSLRPILDLSYPHT